MFTQPMLWIQYAAAGYVIWRAHCHILHQSPKTLFMVTAFWGLLGAAAAWVISDALAGHPSDPLRVSLLVLVALGCGFDRRRFDRGQRLHFLQRLRASARDRRRPPP